MIKFIVAAVWICAVSIGAVVYSFQTSAAKNGGAEEAAAPMLGGLDYIKTDMISVPLVRDSKVQGYFLAQLVYTADPKMVAKLTVPAESLIVDEVYSYIYSSPDIDFTKTTSLDLEAFKGHLKEAVNKHVGIDLVNEVMVEQIDYLTKDEIRDNALRRRTTDMKTPKFGAEKEKAEGGHEAPAH